MIEERKSVNPLKTVWNIISSIGGAIGLVSFVDDLYSWGTFIDQLLIAYRSIVYWPFDWLCFEVDDWIKDYLFFGFLSTSSAIKSTTNWHLMRYLISDLKRYALLVGLLIIFLWPLFLLLLIVSYKGEILKKLPRMTHYLSTWNEKEMERIYEMTKNDEEFHQEYQEYEKHQFTVTASILSRKFFQWLGAVFLIFMGFLIFNIIVNR